MGYVERRPGLAGGHQAVILPERARWESLALRQYSSLDGDSLAELVLGTAWTNEGLFALLQGLRRLKQIGGSPVNVPAIEWQPVS